MGIRASRSRRHRFQVRSRYNPVHLSCWVHLFGRRSWQDSRTYGSNLPRRRKQVQVVGHGKESKLWLRWLRSPGPTRGSGARLDRAHCNRIPEKAVHGPASFKQLLPNHLEQPSFDLRVLRAAARHPVRVTALLPPPLFSTPFFGSNSRGHWWGCIDPHPLTSVGSTTISVCSWVGSNVPLPIYADVRNVDDSSHSLRYIWACTNQQGHKEKDIHSNFNVPYSALQVFAALRNAIWIKDGTRTPLISMFWGDKINSSRAKRNRQNNGVRLLWHSVF